MPPPGGGCKNWFGPGRVGPVPLQMNSTGCVFCERTATISVPHPGGGSPVWSCEGCACTVFPDRVAEEKIKKIDGQLEDLKEERRETTERYILGVKGIITDDIKTFSNRQCFRILRNLVNHWEALENDQDSYEEILCKKRKALIDKLREGEAKKQSAKSPVQHT